MDRNAFGEVGRLTMGDSKLLAQGPFVIHVTEDSRAPEGWLLATESIAPVLDGRSEMPATLTLQWEADGAEHSVDADLLEIDLATDTIHFRPRAASATDHGA